MKTELRTSQSMRGTEDILPSYSTVGFVSVIVPTYCEGPNLTVLVSRVSNAFRQTGLFGEILIVDDNSPDDTAAVCAKLADQHPVRLIVRKNERGLSSAVLHGFNNARGEILVVMDADLSHPPEAVPEMIKTLCQPNVDFVVGSRYVPGGQTDAAWGFFRWLNSKVATLLARPLTNISDPMAGFFAIRRDTYRAADRLDPIGYKIGLELLVKAQCKGVREIPIHFRDRLHGESKLNFREQVNYLRHLVRLMRYKFLPRRSK